MRSWNAINKSHGYLQMDTNFTPYVQQRKKVNINNPTRKTISLQFSGHVEETKHTTQKKKIYEMPHEYKGSAKIIIKIAIKKS